jgi:hypothetical protein
VDYRTRYSNSHDSRDCYAAPAHGWDGLDTAAYDGCGVHTSRCSSVAQQPTVGAYLPISRRAVEPRC